MAQATKNNVSSKRLRGSVLSIMVVFLICGCGTTVESLRRRNDDIIIDRYNEYKDGKQRRELIKGGVTIDDSYNRPGVAMHLKQEITTERMERRVEKREVRIRPANMVGDLIVSGIISGLAGSLYYLENFDIPLVYNIEYVIVPAVSLMALDYIGLSILDGSKKIKRNKWKHISPNQEEVDLVGADLKTIIEYSNRRLKKKVTTDNNGVAFIPAREFPIDILKEDRVTLQIEGSWKRRNYSTSFLFEGERLEEIKDIITQVQAQPVLSYEYTLLDSSRRVDSSSHRDNNWDEKEIVKIIITVKNEGKGVSRKIEVSLDSESDIIDIIFNGARKEIDYLFGGESTEVVFIGKIPPGVKKQDVKIEINIKDSEDNRPKQKKILHIAIKPEEIIEATEIISKIIDVDEIPHFNNNSNALAVVIGIENYQNLPEARYARHDAEIFKEYLVEAFGLKNENIISCYDSEATKTKLITIFKQDGWLDLKMQGDSRELFVYFSGHGASSQKQEKPYLMPFNADPDFLGLTSYSLYELYDDLRNLETKQTYLFIDACFSGLSGRGDKLETIIKGTRGISPSLVTSIRTLVRGNIIVLSATDENEYSSDIKENKHGIFTYYLLKGIRGDYWKKGYNELTIKDLFEYVKKNVSLEAANIGRRQTPCLYPSLETMGDKSKSILLRY